MIFQVVFDLRKAFIEHCQVGGSIVKLSYFAGAPGPGDLESNRDGTLHCLLPGGAWDEVQDQEWFEHPPSHDRQAGWYVRIV